MRSSISSSDRAFILSLALWTAALAVALNLVALYGLDHWRWLSRRINMPKFEVAVNLQDYVMDYPRCPVVVLGSSVVLAVPPPGWERPGVCSIALLGQGSLLGLSVMARTPAAPRLLFVESSFGFRDAAPDEVAADADPALRALHAWLPLTSARANWVNMLGKSQYTSPTDLYRPSEPWADWRASHKSYMDVYSVIYGNPLNDGARQYLGQLLVKTQALIAEMEKRGTKVIFFEAPLDPQIAALPIIAIWRDMMHEAFADHDWVTDSPEKYYQVDGMHLVSGSGADFFNLLMAKLPPNMAAVP